MEGAKIWEWERPLLCLPLCCNNNCLYVKQFKQTNNHELCRVEFQICSTSLGTHVASLLEILSFATSHYATGMQLIVICNYLGHVCNYKFGIV
jgi:hypothetical protein